MKDYLELLAGSASRLEFLDPERRWGTYPEPLLHLVEPGGHGHDPLGPGPHPARNAFILATLSGISLPIGAILGIRYRPDDATVSRWIAVGAGALLFAVSVELYGHAIHSYYIGSYDLIPTLLLMVVSMFGSYFFTWVSRQLGDHNDAEAGDDEDDEEACEVYEPCEHCGKSNKTGVPFCNWCGMPPAAPLTQRSRGSRGSHGSQDDRRRSQSMPLPGAFSLGLSSSALLSSPSARTTANIKCTSSTSLRLRLKKHRKTGISVGAMLRSLKIQEQAKARARWAHLRAALKQMMVIRYLQKQAAARRTSREEQTISWWDSMKEAFGETREHAPSEEELSQLQRQNRTAALTMLMMLVVDGVPEGILMGFLAAAGNLGVTFVVSLMIANFPEAFAGGVMMEMGGFSRPQILCMWGGLALLVGSLAGLSCHLLLLANPDFTGGHHVPLNVQILVATMEGMAGGAMISGISGWMLPEAFERRDKHSSILLSNGFLCTFGFLLSVGIKIALG